MTDTPVLQVRDLSVHFSTRQGLARVIENLDFELMRGEVLCIVGESGCGKSMTALSILGLVPPSGRIAAGEILLKGENLLTYSDAAMRKVRGRDIAIVFQEPMTALNPLYTVGEQVSEVLRAHHNLNRREAMTRAIDMLRSVGIPAPEQRASAYPHQLSGGMRQRVMIAMALVCEPDVLICDEPTTALDVTVQAQVLDLLRDLRERTGTAIIMITHDMGVVAEIADRVLVMYAGRKIEQGSARDIIRTPTHPYTEGLISCVPALRSNLDSEPEPLQEIPGTIPPLTELGNGCVFEQRCKLAVARCKEAMPPMVDVAENHAAACWVRAKGGSQ